MIDLKDIIFHSNIRKSPRYPGEVNIEKRFACYCEKCGIKRGYYKMSHYNKKKKQCRKCWAKSDEFREKAKQGTFRYNKLNPPKRCPIKAFNNKLGGNLRSRLNQAIKNNQKAGSAVADLGCSVEELRAYLESKFEPGMTWENHSLTGWHIDHIKCLDSFDLSDREQLKEACNYANLQPLWAKENIKKSNK